MISIYRIRVPCTSAAATKRGKEAKKRVGNRRLSVGNLPFLPTSDLLACAIPPHPYIRDASMKTVDRAD
ncbi:uncharacterized protein EAE97_006872 [Botrytis byssoidea]|uniref:Uncharacterized protein n=1 Tax=Botrytis byssoidea TaxID=139641 RepID=A0A9P5IJB1_9HELO|nr:uncharacterized protein EAE97_006872 [Botrytis byssoidea]KAF7940686.1 hypothetical protein EAE97_006872 [Botrytis byssoidea]